MSEIRSLILILQFVRELEKVGSFAGETHIQKGLFLSVPALAGGKSQGGNR